MSLDTLLLAIALMLLFEGVLPFLSPQRWREIFRKVLLFNDDQIRFMGLIAITISLLIFIFM